MRHIRSLDFDDLEGRQLLSTAHHPVAHKPVAHKLVAHKAPAVVLVPLTVSGTLSVDNNAASQNTDNYGDVTTTLPVVGTINGLRTVGDWNETVDSYGDYLGPDTLTLQNSKGEMVLTFNDGSPGKLQKNAQGQTYYQLPQKFYGGTGAYTKNTESGTIDLYTNKAKSIITSLSLSTTSS